MIRSGRYSKTTVKSYNQWPERPEGFRDACEAYTAAVVHLGNLLLGLITVSLGLPFNLFHHCFDTENTIRSRLNYYPQCPLADRVCGVNRYYDELYRHHLFKFIYGTCSCECLQGHIIVRWHLYDLNVAFMYGVMW
jgi:isopenicillin N synthase-like dioxygenase